MWGNSFFIIFRMMPIIRLAVFFGASSEIAILLSSRAVLPSFNLLAATGLDQIAEAYAMSSYSARKQT